MSIDKVATIVKTRDMLLDDIATLARIQQETISQDPDHPVVRHVQSIICQGEEAKLWHTMLYFAYMQLPSAMVAYEKIPTIQDIRWVSIQDPIFKLPTGFERRGLRTRETMARHLDDVAKAAWEWGSLKRWLTHDFTKDPYSNWGHLQETLQCIYGNARWAAYNTGEGLMNINGLPVRPTDMGMRGSTGPRWGLELLYPKLSGERSIEVLDRASFELLSEVQSRGANIRIDELETVLCDFHSMVNGQHYIGHYADLLLQQLLKDRTARVAEKDIDGVKATNPVFAARQAVLPGWMLGENRGWGGERKHLLRTYKEHGVVEWWTVYPKDRPE